ncbi:MAG: sn-glycerol-1-phosphate dehydrogenase [Clostridiales bacterium]|nr:sn-glycerol-1-phosphate dehydrogenase [Clostridiales bacterium]
MKINDLLGREMACSCGKKHKVDIRYVCVEKGAIQKLSQRCEKYERILLVADENTFAAAGREAESQLGGKMAGKLIYSSAHGHVVPDEKSIALMEENLPQNCDLIVGVGSGVINDLCKYVSFEKKLPYIIVATAPSMDGYASSGAAMITAGMKVTYTTHPPMEIIADTDVLCKAPKEMIAGGYGDMVGKYSSLCDWKLGALLHGEYFCQEVYDLVKDTTDHICTLAGGLLAGDEEAIRALTEGLILSGISLSMVQTTRPGSGSEHHLSHYFEIVGLIKDEFSFSHGINVGYGAVLMAKVREDMRKAERYIFQGDDQERRLRDWQRIYGDFVDEVAAIQEKAGWYRRFDGAALQEKWPEICNILSECPTREETLRMIGQVGLDYADFEKTYGLEKIKDALRYGKDLKDRYTILWPYYFWEDRV